MVLGKQLAKNLPEPVPGIAFCKVDHPSSGFRYQDHVQSLKVAIEEATKIKALVSSVN